MKYFIKTPWWLKKIYPSFTWDIKTNEKIVYLTFDDGPHEKATPYVLNELKKYNAKGTFFCVGKNVISLPELYDKIIAEGHTTGNHTYNHLNGWKTNDAEYLNDVVKAANHIDSSLFRPPYGRIGFFQAKNIKLALKDEAAKIIMWDVLSGDFDNGITKEDCLQNVILNVRPGSVVVFHDSEKAFHHLEYCLPRMLELLSTKGFQFKSLYNSRTNKSNDGEKPGF
jgi:peptidoglycan/xylan/chitin deacetylase (PgdA/CDA1 family)